MVSRILATMLCVLFAGLGCREFSASKAVGPRAREAQAQRVESTRILPIDSPIRIRLHETLRPTGRPLQLYCQTTQEYSYLGCTILANVRRHERLVTVEFTGVADPQGGATMPGPARVVIPLDVTGEGHYGLQFKVNGEVVPARVSISADSFEVTHGEGRWITFPLPVLHRVPPGTIWGQITWGLADRTAQAQAFLDSLVRIGAQSKRLPPGDYEYFRIDRTGTIMPWFSGAYFDRTFLYGYDGDWLMLGGLVKAFAGPVGIFVYDDLGRHWYGYRQPVQTVARYGTD
jgi:hypothetical protein